MAAPAPPKPLSGDCSALDGTTLYDYSSAAFQSLRLAANATWAELKNGVAVDGAVCVRAEGALWVVGGVPTDSSKADDYFGLQRYTFANKTWETVTPQVNVTQGRQNHAAVYLPGLESILIYAGSQWNASRPSVETFLVSTRAPFQTESFISRNVPVVAPTLLVWDDTTAITLGGTASNTNISAFSREAAGWRRIDPSLPTPLKAKTAQQLALVQGADGSRVLQMYDMSVAPNVVSSLLLLDADGNAVNVGTFLNGTKASRKRDLSVDSWPVYNSSFASKTTRTGFALAANDDGMVAISGGSGDAPSVAIFNQNNNAWVDTASLFGDSADFAPSSSAVSSSAASTAASTSAASTSAPSRTSSGSARLTSSAPTASPTIPLASMPKSGPSTILLLGSILGALLAFVLLVIAAMMILRSLRNKRNAGKTLDDDDDDDDEKDRLSFVDRSGPFVAQPYSAHASTGVPPPPAPAHLRGFDDRHVPAHHRSETQMSGRSTTHLVPHTYDHYEMDRMGNQVQPSYGANNFGAAAAGPAPAPQPKRTSGWSRYFSGTDGGSAKGRNSAKVEPLVGDGQGHGHGHSRSQDAASKIFAARKARQSTDTTHDRRPHAPVQLPPLDMGTNFKDADADVQSIDAGAPRTASMRTASSAFSVRSHSIAPSVWSHDSVHDAAAWTPATRSDNASSRRGVGRPRDTGTSSFYGEPHAHKLAQAQKPLAGAGLSRTTTRAEYAGAGPAATTDMSWLNLNAAR